MAKAKKGRIYPPVIFSLYAPPQGPPVLIIDAIPLSPCPLFPQPLSMMYGGVKYMESFYHISKFNKVPREVNGSLGGISNSG